VFKDKVHFHRENIRTQESLRLAWCGDSDELTFFEKLESYVSDAFRKQKLTFSHRAIEAFHSSTSPVLGAQGSWSRSQLFLSQLE